MADLVTDKVVVALHRIGMGLLFLTVVSVIAAVGFTKDVDGLVTAGIAAGLTFALPGVAAFGLAYWFDGQAAALQGHPRERRPIPEDSPARHPFRAPMTGYLLAIVATAGGWGLRALIDPLLPGSVPFITFFAAIAISGWFGGYGPAVLSTMLSAMIARYFYMTPVYAFLLMDPEQAMRLGTFVLIGLVIGGLSAALRAALERVQELNDQLDALRSANPPAAHAAAEGSPDNSVSVLQRNT